MPEPDDRLTYELTQPVRGLDAAEELVNATKPDDVEMRYTIA
jgi:hypothetical protein